MWNNRRPLEEFRLPRDRIGDLRVTTGLARTREEAYLGMVVPDLVEQQAPHTMLIGLTPRELVGIRLHWSMCAVSRGTEEGERFVAVGQYGDVVVGDLAATREERGLLDGPQTPRQRGPLVTARTIGRHVYAVGTTRQCYRRSGPDQWTCIDASAQHHGKDITDYSFQAIDGFDEEEIYTVGWEGEIWRWDGARWTLCDSPTNLALHTVVCAGDGNVYAAGQVGTLLRGCGDDWAPIEHDCTEEDFWDAAWFGDRLYLSTSRFVYALDRRGVLERVSFAPEAPLSAYHLRVVDGLLWSIGPDDVLTFDGVAWTRII